MDHGALQQLVLAEDRHWWFVGRRRIVGKVLEALGLPKGARMLEAGCGGGGNLPLLARFGEVWAFELERDACAAAQSRGIGTVCAGSLPHEFPFAGQRFDAILLLDVLEHLTEPEASLRVLGDALAPGGHLIVTVPAYQWLWSQHDVLNEHVRRFTLATLEEQLAAGGFALALGSYFNSTLFPVAVAARLASRFGRQAAELEGLTLPPGNEVLARLFGAERHMAARGWLPFGLSVLGVATYSGGSS